MSMVSRESAFVWMHSREFPLTYAASTWLWPIPQELEWIC